MDDMPKQASTLRGMPSTESPVQASINELRRGIDQLEGALDLAPIDNDENPMPSGRVQQVAITINDLANRLSRCVDEARKL